MKMPRRLEAAQEQHAQVERLAEQGCGQRPEDQSERREHRERAEEDDEVQAPVARPRAKRGPRQLGPVEEEQQADGDPRQPGEGFGAVALARPPRGGGDHGDQGQREVVEEKSEIFHCARPEDRGRGETSAQAVLRLTPSGHRVSIKGQEATLPAGLSDLHALPRPLYGHVEALPNRMLGYRHRHPWIQLAYAAQGVIEVRTDRGRYVAPPQRAVWIPQEIPHRVWCRAGTSIRSLYIDSGAGHSRGDACRVLVVDSLLRELIDAFSLVPVRYAVDGADGRLAAVLLDRIAAAPEADLMLPLPSDPDLRQLCRSAQLHPSRKASLRALSEQRGVSEKTLSRLFLRETGLTFRAWLQRMRLLGALPALERGARVTDVALDCGYESLSAFIAAFRKLFDASPGEFFGARRDPT